jgi:outer membrane beta-barrel protein
MRKELAVFGIATLGAAALYSAPAAAQKAVSQEVQIYAGELIGDRMTETPFSGNTPRLDNDATFGARYTYNFTEMWGVQLSAGYSPSRASYVASGDSNLGLTTVDVDGVWNFTPDYRIAGYRIVGYTVAGVGYAWAHLDQPIQGGVGGRFVTITDSNGLTANAGIGVKVYLTGNLFVDLEARYRYLDRIVNNYSQGMNTAETTLGVGWRF